MAFRAQTRRWPSPSLVDGVAQTGVWELGFAADELVCSWNLTAPAGERARIEVRARSAAGVWSGWFIAAWWGDDPAVVSTSVPGQGDDVARMDVDTVVAADGVLFDAVELRVSAATSIAHLSIVASRDAHAAAPVSTPTLVGTLVEAPPMAQHAHDDLYPEIGGGGASWCSPTSVAMALARLGAGPSQEECAWVEGAAYPASVHAARGCLDEAYAGCGNWSFNAAHVGTRGLDGFVTRVADLAAAEPLLAAGLPVVVSTRFTAEELPGAGYGTAGHLMLLVGIDADGDPILNDPAAGKTAEASRVRVTYPRAAFEAAMARAGRVAYVITPTR